MQLEDYFDFEKTDDYERIRVKGTRIDIEYILNPFIQGESAPRIFYSYSRSLTLEQVYATVTYYLHNKAEIDGYLQRSHEVEERAFQEYLKQEPPEVVKRLRALKAERILRGTTTIEKP